mgnify:CR=1 FL=1
MKETDTLFRKMIDEIIAMAEHDPELKEGIQWLDKIAIKNGMSFYDIIFKVLMKHDREISAKKWLEDKDNA